MHPTRAFPEWRDDMPRTFSVPELAPHVPSVHAHRRRLGVTVLLPRIAALAVRPAAGHHR